MFAFASNLNPQMVCQSIKESSSWNLLTGVDRNMIQPIVANAQVRDEVDNMVTLETRLVVHPIRNEIKYIVYCELKTHER